MCFIEQVEIQFKFAMLKGLGFDKDFVSSLDNSAAFVNIVDHVLLHHIGPINHFVLCYKDPVATSHIDRWILHVSRNSIKAFVLHFCGESHYKVPSSLFSCHQSFVFILQCNLKPPLTFKGFRSLKYIDLRSVSLDQHVFEDLVSCSPLLESLTFLDVKGACFKINAPKVRFLKLRGQFEDVFLENTSNLTHVTIDPDDIDVSRLLISGLGSSSRLVQLFAHLPQIQSLAIKENFLPHLSFGSAPSELPNPCLHLKFLFINICFFSNEEILAALCLLRSSPVLQELEVEAFTRDEKDRRREMTSWFDDHRSDRDHLPNLHRVKITDISGGTAENRFDQIFAFMFANAQVDDC